MLVMLEPGRWGITKHNIRQICSTNRVWSKDFLQPSSSSMFVDCRTHFSKWTQTISPRVTFSRKMSFLITLKIFPGGATSCFQRLEKSLIKTTGESICFNEGNQKAFFKKVETPLPHLYLKIDSRKAIARLLWIYFSRDACCSAPPPILLSNHL